MELIDSLAVPAGRHAGYIGFGLAAVTLVPPGNHPSGMLRRLTRGLSWLLGYASFVLLRTAGYTAMAGYPWNSLPVWLSGLPSRPMLALSISLYLLPARQAKRDRLI